MLTKALVRGVSFCIAFKMRIFHKNVLNVRKVLFRLIHFGEIFQQTRGKLLNSVQYFT